MGCSVSADGTVAATGKRPREFLYREDTQLVQDSWNVLQQHREQMGLIIFQRLFIEQRQLLMLFTKLMTREQSGGLVFDETQLKKHVKAVMDTINNVINTLDDVHSLKVLLFNMGERHALYGVEPDMIPVTLTKISLHTHAAFFSGNLKFRTVDSILTKIMVYFEDKTNRKKKTAALLLNTRLEHDKIILQEQHHLLQLMWPGVLAGVQKVMGHEFTPKLQQAWEHVFHYVGHKIMDGIRDGIKSGSA